MGAFYLLIGIIFAIIAYKCYDSANKLENKPVCSQNSEQQSNPTVNQGINNHREPQPSKKNDDESVIEQEDSTIKSVERYNSWIEYKMKHPHRAKEIIALGIDLSSKNNQDASEWIFAIETTAKDSNCKISELKRKYFESIEKYNPSDADWIYAIKGLTEFSKKESGKYNLKIGNTAADMMLLFIFEKIKEVESKYNGMPILTSSDPLTLQMRFMLDSHDDVLMLQKMHIYTRNYPMTERSKEYRDNWHTQMMEIIEKRIAKYDNIKENPSLYNCIIDTEIYKIIYDEILKDVPRDLVDEFNSHLLSFHEEMDIISKEASKIFHIII